MRRLGLENVNKSFTLFRLLRLMVKISVNKTQVFISKLKKIVVSS